MNVKEVEGYGVNGRKEKKEKSEAMSDRQRGKKDGRGNERAPD
jgi:hypothetical protein